MRIAAVSIHTRAWPHRLAGQVISAVVAVALVAAGAAAQDVRYWDIDGPTPGAGGPTPSGTWSGTAANWSTSPDGDVVTDAWVSGAGPGNGNAAFFSAGSDATGSFTVTVDGTNNASGLIVKTGTVNITGGGVVALGSGTATVMPGATLGISSISRVTQSAGGLLVLDGATLQSTTGFAGSLWTSTGDGIQLTANGGTVSYGASSVVIYQGRFLGAGGTVDNGGAQTLTKTGTGELRVQTAATGSFTFQKLVVNQGLYRIGSSTVSPSAETGFGAIPLEPTPDAITLDGGAIGVTVSISTDPFRGITLGSSGGVINALGANGAVLTLNGPITGPGVLRVIGHRGAVINGINTSTGGTIIGSDIAMVGGITTTTGGTLTINTDSNLGAVPASVDPANVQLGTATAPGQLTVNATTLFPETRGFKVGGARGTLSNGAATTVTLAGPLSGTGGFIKTNSGTLVLSGSNTLTGGITSSGGGAIQVSADANLGGVPVATASNAITLADATSSGRLRVTESFTMPATRGITVNVGGTTATPLGGTIDVATDKILTVAGPITGAGRLTKSGSGTLVLAGTSTYAGTTTVGGGTLVVDGVLSGTAAVTLLGGATLAGSGTVGGDARIAAFTTLAPGTGPGSLAFGRNLTWAAGGDYNWQMLSATGTAGATNAWDLVTVSGTLDITATSADPFAINLWSLSSGSPVTSGSAANFDPTQNQTWTIARTTGGITGFAADTVVVTTSSTNGTGGFANDLDGGTFGLAVSGNDLNLVFTSTSSPTVITINVPSGTQTQTQAGYPTLAASIPVIKTGAGTLVLDQSNTLTGSTTVQGGVLQLSNSSALASSTLAVPAGGTAQVAPGLTTTVGGLSLSGSGLVNVTSGFVTVASGLAATDLVNQIIAGRNNGLWTGTSGITSTTAASHVALGVPRAVGWLDNGDGSVAFAYAAPGDTNLDWKVDVLDVANVLAGGRFNAGAPATWNQGDFNYDGVVDVLDAAGFITTGLYDTGPYNGSSGATGAVAAVPEPTLGLVGIATLAAAAALATRRR